MIRPASLLLVLLIAPAAFAQAPGIELKIDSTTLEVGEAVDARLVCTNTGVPGVPKAAVPDGLDLQLLSGTPSQSTQVSVINDRMWQQTTYTYALRLVAVKEGKYTIGPVTVEADGKTYTAKPITVAVTRGQDQTGLRGDRELFVEIDVEPTSLFVTESFDATLTIGVRKVVINGRAYDIDFLDLFDQSSQLSVFLGSTMTKSDLTLTDSNGQRHAYVVYKVRKRIRAEQVGEVLVGPVFLKLRYPTALRRGFFMSLEVSRSRKVTARAQAVSVEVEGPPQEGRPESFTGAIGTYNMRVTAKPTRVEQGQPVTLSIAITGEPLSGVAGPDLSRQVELTARFEFVADELVGELEGDAKVFRRAVFPKQQGEQTIPSIAWSYFDPGHERYVALASEPIPLVVDPPSSPGGLALRTQSQSNSEETPLKVLVGGISPNYVDPAAVLADQSFIFTRVQAALLVFPPIAWASIMLLARHRERIRSDRGFARRRGARRRAESLMAKAARNGNPAERLSGLALAMTGYVSDRFDLPPGKLTSGDVRALLHANGIDDALANEICGFLEECEAARYAPGAAANISAGDAVQRVRSWMKRLERAVR